MRLDLEDVKFIDHLDEKRLSQFSVAVDDLLFTRYNGSRHLVARCARVPEHAGPLLHPDKLIRVILPAGMADSRFMMYQMESAMVRRYIEPRIRTTAGQSGIAGGDIRGIPVVIPPLDEQYRIVEVLEDHLSRLDPALETLRGVAARLRPLVGALLRQIVPTGEVRGWRLTTVGEAGQVQLGRQRHPDWHTGPEMKPYLRVANVFEDRIDTRDVMEMDFSGVFERYRLIPGDVLLNEGQSPEFLGRPAIYRGEPPEVAFTNSLIRFKANSDVLPEWALLVFRRHMHSGRFIKESRITTNIAHLSASRLKNVEFPIPPLGEQQNLVDLANDRLSAIERLKVELGRRLKQERALRRSLLEAAFSGRLTGSTPAIEMAEEMAGV
ncbi:MAG: restriction endonuclease subunit S [Pseudonocardiaceae bacterium]